MKQRNGPVGRVFEMDFETDKQLFFSEGILEMATIKEVAEKKTDFQQSVETITQKVDEPVKDEIDNIPF